MSERRVLLFDIGNTRVKWGYAVGVSLRRTGSIAHERLAEEGFDSVTDHLPVDVDRVLASNMAGASFGANMTAVIREHCGRPIKFVRSSEAACGVTNSYRQPRRLGVDRWAGMIGARHEFKSALCIVDAGTAVTIDALDESGQHLGGQILPGFGLMNTALHTYTTGLPLIRRAPARSADSPTVFAKSTGDGIYQGVLGSICGAIDRCMRSLRQMGYRPVLVLTGGDASRIKSDLEGHVEVRPKVVIQGLAVMAHECLD